MKGKAEIKVTLTDDTGSFPETTDISLSFDYYPEGIGWWIDNFKKILNWAGFEKETIEEEFREIL